MCRPPGQNLLCKSLRGSKAHAQKKNREIFRCILSLKQQPPRCSGRRAQRHKHRLSPRDQAPNAQNSETKRGYSHTQQSQHFRRAVGTAPEERQNLRTWSRARYAASLQMVYTIREAQVVERHIRYPKKPKTTFPGRINLSLTTP